jgi:hypothetical protein
MQQAVDKLLRLLGGHNRPAAIVPTEFTDLLAELLGVADCLRGIPAGAAPDAELAIETSEYRNNVEQFGRMLPWVQGTSASGESTVADLAIAYDRS